MAIEQLELQISDNAGQAVDGLEALRSTLERLKSATSNNAGLTKVAKSLEKIKSAVSGLNLGNLPAQMQELARSMEPLQNLGKTNLNSFINSLKKVPDVTKSLDPTTIERFGTAVQRVAEAVKPLATEMEKISMGFSAMPKRIQSFITQMERSGKGATTAAKGYHAAAGGLSLLNQKFNLSVLVMSMRRLSNVLGGFVENSNQYVEDMNLFTVSMGEFADAAYEYAQSAQELMGIDAGQFMRSQGFFQSIASGFGVASNQASVLSQNLAQLGYDLASFYNSDVETAMQKLQSGLAGELEPLRRWGFALDQITLQETARAHGIQMSIREMNQAQKAQIRYIAIMEQSVNAQHDMARTLTTPANAMRIFNQQITLLGRSVGNILIPALSAILPYAIAVAKVLRMVADAIASLFGFTLPTIDYDAFGGLEVGAGAAEGIEDAMGGAASDAKKLRDYVLGIDELNIIRPDDNGGSGGSGLGAIGGGFEGLELPEYDFLDGLSEQVDTLVPKMAEFLKWTGAIVAAFAGWKIVKNIIGWVKNLYTWMSKLSPGALKAFTGIMSLVAAIGSLVGGFLIGEELTKLFTGEIDTLSAKFAAGAILVGGMTVALGFLLGPLGIAVGLFAGLVGAIAGNHSVMQKLNQEMVDSLLFAPNGGIPIQLIADDFSKLTTSIIEAQTPIREYGEEMQSVGTEIRTLSGDLMGMVHSLGTSREEIAAMIEPMGQTFDALFDATTRKVNASREMLESFYGTVAPEIFEKYGTTAEEVTAKVNQSADDALGPIQEIATEWKKTQDALSVATEIGDVAEIERLKTELAEISRQMINSSTEGAEALELWDAKLKGFGEIDLSGLGHEELVQLLTNMSDAAIEANTVLGDVVPQINEAFRSIGLDDETAKAIAGDMLKLQAEDIAAGLQSTAEALGPQIDAVFEAALQDYEFSLWDKINAVGQVGTDNGWSLSQSQKNVATAAVQKDLADIYDAVDTLNAVSQLGMDFAQGLADGITTNSVLGVDAAKQFGKESIEALKLSLDEHSPSKLTTELGMYFDQGFANGVSENTKLAVDSANKLGKSTLDALVASFQNASAPINAFKNILNQMLGLVESFTRNMIDGINNAMSSIVSAFNSVNYSGNNASFSHAGKVNIPRLASGGIVNSGQLFIGRESGPELVGNFGSKTGVMNNDQIVGAVSAGVYEAMTAAMSVQGGDGQPIIIQLDGRTIYESNVRQDQSYGYAGFRQTAVNLG